MKIPFKPGTLIYPLPAVMVTCGDCEENYNILTVAWTGTICSDPPMCYVSIRKERHSYALIKKNMEFVINLTTEDLAAATDWCGVRSGRDYNKFKEMTAAGFAKTRARDALMKEFKIGSTATFYAALKRVETRSAQ